MDQANPFGNSSRWVARYFPFVFVTLRAFLWPTVVLVGGLATYLLFIHRLADRDLWSSHEARAAMDAESVLDGDGPVPHLHDGRAELQKPPLYYWLVALAARLRGRPVDAWAVRLPAAVSALGCLFLLAWFGNRLGRPRTGVVAAAILATAVHFPWLARIGRIDMPLTFAVTAACLAFYISQRSGPEGRGSEFGRRSLLAVGYVAVAAAILLKGPIGAVLPGVVLFTHRVVAGRLPNSALRTANSLWWGVPLVLVLTVPWFLWANAATGGEFFRVFLWHHNLERGLGGSTLHSHPWWLYLPYFANDFLPWTPVLIAAVAVAWRRGWLRTDADARFGLVWLGAVVGTLSCASFKRADYLLPAYPGAALFLACILSRLAGAWQAAPRRLLTLRLVTVVLAIAVVVGWTVRVEHDLPSEEPFRDYRRFAALIRAIAPAPAPIVLFQTEAHALAFHVGRPVAVVVECQDLQSRIAGGQADLIVMPDRVADSPIRLDGVRLREVLRNTDLSGGRHERPLVLMQAALEPSACRTCPNSRRSPTSP
jgi:4-amino-4-deoxy-L-arabinose transferase-like glycosyltransferase